MNGFIAFGPIPVGRGAASCRPLRSWPLSRGARVASPRCPILRPSFLSGTSQDCGWAISFSLVLARRLALAVASFSLRAAQMASGATGQLLRWRDVGDRVMQPQRVAR